MDDLTTRTMPVLHSLKPLKRVLALQNQGWIAGAGVEPGLEGLSFLIFSGCVLL